MNETYDGPVPSPWDDDADLAPVTPLRREGAANTAELLNEVKETLERYVIFPSDEAATATALWVAVTHALPAFQSAPRLAINSPEKRCGKSRLLDVVAALSHKPLSTVNATVAAVFRSIGGEHPPTLILDEADTIWGTKRQAEANEDLRALVNAGFQRGRPALRCVGQNQEPTEFPTFAAVALAGIGDCIPDTVTDRAVCFTLRRRTVDEHVSTFRTRRDGPVLEALNARLQRWAIAVVDTLATAEPDMPVEDRAADTWEPLIAVADLAGDVWAANARHACTTLTSAAEKEDEEGNLNTLLLSDIQGVFERTGTTFMQAQVLITQLSNIEESPWGEWELTPRKLALRLKHFGIRTNRNTMGTARGYRLEDLTDAFHRYIRQNPSEASETPE